MGDKRAGENAVVDAKAGVAIDKDCGEMPLEAGAFCRATDCPTSSPPSTDVLTRATGVEVVVLDELAFASRRSTSPGRELGRKCNDLGLQRSH